MRIYDYMKGILGAMGVGEDVGVPEPSWRIEEYLKAIYDKLKEGGSGSLPSVTSSDNGKVLAVKDGAWAADSNLFLVTVTGPASDKSRSEILDAIAKGRSVALIKGTSYYFPSGQDNSYVYFISEAKIANDRYLNVIAVNESKVASVDKLYMLPNPSSSDNGKELVIKNSSVAYQDKKFVVTLTPTSPDYSGTMDKTPQEITAAYNAGQEIVFTIPTLGTAFNAFEFVTSGTNVQAGSVLTYRTGSSHLLIECLTSSSDDDNTYSTTVYSLTPAS